jgi:hypothetical protein
MRLGTGRAGYRSARRLAACPKVAHLDSPPFSGRPSQTGHCGHGWTCSLPRPVAIDIRQLQDGTVKKGLHRPRLSAIIPNLTAAGSHPDCRAVLIQIVALHRFPNGFLTHTFVVFWGLLLWIKRSERLSYVSKKEAAL